MFSLALFAVGLVFFSGCCCLPPDDGNGTVIAGSSPPDVEIRITNRTEDLAPFDPTFSYHCRDADGDLQYCALLIDGHEFARGPDQTTLLPDDFEYPEVYTNATRVVGTHSLEIVGVDEAGRRSSSSASFTVLNAPPYVRITLDNESGPAPFYPRYRYSCEDPDNDLAWCAFQLDDQTFAVGVNGSDPFANFTRPEFYDAAAGAVGVHELKLIGMDQAGLQSEHAVNFTVLRGAWLEEPGWYSCNDLPNPPCDLYREAYCPYFVPLDLDVRRAASEAISAHPGKYSANQILDVYDWMYQNVIYQNVPVNLTYQPYPPNETLRTRSGDCKNHAVLIASMIEAIGGRARVLIVPGCQHAYAEVYIGNGTESSDRFADAIFAHYGSRAPGVRWHTSGEEVWFAIDTAGGSFPGNTIESCYNATQTFVLLNCGLNKEKMNAPDLEYIEYGPFPLDNKVFVNNPGYWTYYTLAPDTGKYEYCTYHLNFAAKSRLFDFYVIPHDEYGNFNNDNPFRYYYEEKQVANVNYDFNYDQADQFDVIIRNADRNNAVTIVPNSTYTCYKK